MAVKCADYGDRAGFICIWQGSVKCGDDFEPERYEYEVEFDLGNDVKNGCFAYLQMMTNDIHFNYNAVYVNGTKVGTLTRNTDGWRVDTFVVAAGVVKKGKNKFKLTARNSSGGYTGNVDDIWVQDPMMIYAVG